MRALAQHRRVRALVGLVLLEVAIVSSLAIVGAARRAGDVGARTAGRALASDLHLTDLALWGGASYSRSPSTADGFAAFSEHPGAIEHLPAGSLVPPHGAISASRGKAPGGR